MHPPYIYIGYTPKSLIHQPFFCHMNLALIAAMSTARPVKTIRKIYEPLELTKTEMSRKTYLRFPSLESRECQAMGYPPKRNSCRITLFQKTSARRQIRLKKVSGSGTLLSNFMLSVSWLLDHKFIIGVVSRLRESARKRYIR